MASKVRPSLYVLAGVNGAGKSSIGGAMFRASNADYFNPDEAARRILAIHRHVGIAEANGVAWNLGKSLLEKAISRGLDFAFETTLGGNTMPNLIAQAAGAGFEVNIWYAGLATVELHLERVRSRVAAGGHDIPEEAILRRWDRSRQNLIKMLPVLTRLRLFDNSISADFAGKIPPSPHLVLEMHHQKILAPPDLSATPDWAKPIVAAALKMTARPQT